MATDPKVMAAAAVPAHMSTFILAATRMLNEIWSLS